MARARDAEARTAATWRSRRWARARTTRRSCSTWASRRSTWATAARAAAGPTTPSSTPSTTTPASAIPPSSTASRWPRRRGAPRCAWPTPTCCPSGTRAWPTACDTYLGQVKKLADDMRDETEHLNKLVDEKAYTLAADPTETWVPPEKKEPGAVPQLRAAGERRGAPEEGGGRLRRGPGEEDGRRRALDAADARSGSTSCSRAWSSA